MKKDTILQELYTILKTANRIGAEKDIPEGSRCISISDTLANQLADRLKPLLTGEQK